MDYLTRCMNQLSSQVAPLSRYVVVAGLRMRELALAISARYEVVP